MSGQQGAAERLIDAVQQENLVALGEILSQKQQQGGGGANDDDVIAVTDDDVEKALKKAARIGNVEAIDLLFNGLSESTKEVHRQEKPLPSNRFHHLAAACLYRNPDVVRFLVVDCRCNTNQLEGRETPLCLAYRSVEISRILLQNGADPNKCYRNTWTNHPLYIALMMPYHPSGLDIDVVRLLLEYGADPNFPRRPDVINSNRNRHLGHPPASRWAADRAMENRDEQVLSLLLHYGAILGPPPGFVDPEGGQRCSSLIRMLDSIWSQEKKLSICRTLVEHALLNSSNCLDYIQTDIDEVMCYYDKCFGDVLLQSGVIPQNRATMHKAVQEGKISTCRLLVQNGVNPFQQENSDHDGACSLFQTAAAQNDTSIFEFFLDLWDDDRFTSTTHGGHEDDKPPMHVVCGYSNVSLQTIELLIERQGHTLMVVDPEHGLRPFLVASMCNAKLDVIYTLLHQEADALSRSRGNNSTHR